MPGRKSTAPLPLLPKSSKSRNLKRKRERSLNALAIAEKTDPERTKIRRHRLGESESDGNDKRNRAVAQQVESRDEDGVENSQRHSKAKRRRVNGDRADEDGFEHGSGPVSDDSSVGGVATDDDESLDSDEAMGESDEEKFEGFIFRGSSSKSKKQNSVKIQRNEEDFEGIDPSEDGKSAEGHEDFGDEGVDLATALDIGTGDEGTEEAGSRAGSVEGAEHNGNEVSEDEDSALSVSDDGSDLKDPARLANLQSLVMAMAEQDEAQAPTGRLQHVNETSAPSEYGLNSKNKLTVADLLHSVKDPKLKKSLRLLGSNDTKTSSKRNSMAKKLDVPLPKRQQDRLDRAAAYEKTKETLNRWIDTVKHNRRAEHLSFPLEDPDAFNAQGGNKMERHAKPLTDLESTIQNILRDSGLAPTPGKSEEEQIKAFEELETNKLPLEEVQARRAELRRARDLLFREEIRARRIKKIKSKSYRRVHRKERERLAQRDKEALAAAGVEDSESEKEKKDRRRAEERMGAKHREGRWAKGVKESGRMAWDEDARAGVEEMARREENLRQRMLGKDVDDSSEKETSDEEEEEDEMDATNQRALGTLQARLQRLGDNGDKVRAGVRDSTSALSSMKFMQNAEAARKASNDEAVQQMQRALTGEESPSEEELENGSGRKLYGPNRTTTQPKKFNVGEQRNEFEERESSGDEGDLPLQADDEELQIIVDRSESAPPASQGQATANKERRMKSDLSSQAPGFTEENPWLSGGKRKPNVHDRRTQDSRAAAVISNELPTTATRAASPSKPTVRHRKKRAEIETDQIRSTSAGPILSSDNDASDRETEEAEEESNAPFVLRNQDLVRKAFAGDDVVANFEIEKEEKIESEEEKIVDDTLAGWGSWVGAGIGKKAQRRNKNRILSKQEGVPKAKRQDARLDKVIINEKRVKKNAKYLASQLPHPFETRQQYERSLRLPVGPEWTTKTTFQAATKPRVLMKQGIITPMTKPII